MLTNGRFLRAIVHVSCSGSQLFKDIMETNVASEGRAELGENASFSGRGTTTNRPSTGAVLRAITFICLTQLVICGAWESAVRLRSIQKRSLPRQEVNTLSSFAPWPQDELIGKFIESQEDTENVSKAS